MIPNDEALQGLIESYFDRTADEAQLTELDRRLQERAAAEQFQAFAALDELLRSRLTTEQQEFAARALLADLQVELDDAPRPARRIAPTPSLGRAAVTYLSTPAHFGVFFAAVSCISLMLFFAQVSWPQKVRPLFASAPVEEVTVESLEACRWKGSPLRTGQRVGPERELHLKVGRAVFRSPRGARVELEAPALFCWQDAEVLILRQGRAAARVPRAARGLVIETPTSRIVDLGTEFSVEVDPLGRTEVQVARGAVTFAAHQAPKADAVRLAAKQGAISSADGRAIERVTFEPAQFGTPQRLERTLTSDDVGRLAYRGAQLGLARFRSPQVPKPWDADGDQVLGTAGYFFFNSARGKNRYQEPFTADALSALPDFVERLAACDDGALARTSASYDAYLDLDDPRRPIEQFNSGAGSIASPQAGAVLTLLDLHLGARPPAFRLGVLVDHLRSIDHSAEWNLPEALQLVSSRGDASRSVRLDRARIGDGDWYFFDVRSPEAGEVLTLRITASRARAQAIGGLVFDVLPERAFEIIKD